jgi:hypothetical protein
MKRIENFYKSRNGFSSLVLGILFIFFAILGSILFIIPEIKDILDSPFPFREPWISDFFIFGILWILVNLFFDHYFWNSKRTPRVLIFFEYFIGGILASFIFGSILIVIFMKLTGKDLTNLYLFIPVIGMILGFILCVISNYKKQK